MSITQNIHSLLKKIPKEVTLVAVSKTKPVSYIEEAYNAGQRVFGENRIQEMTQKWESLPKDIQWHMIGHVQTNKIKYMAAYVNTIHAVDSFKLLKEINKQAVKNNRIINCLLQLKIAEEKSKFGLEKEEITNILRSKDLAELQNIKIKGLMGMATFTDDDSQIKKEFLYLKQTFDILKETQAANVEMKILSMGMSGDYPIAIAVGSNMIRVGSAIFGSRK